MGRDGHQVTARGADNSGGGHEGRNEMGVLWQIDDILFSCSILVEARAQSPMTFSMSNFLGSIHT